MAKFVLVSTKNLMDLVRRFRRGGAYQSKGRWEFDREVSRFIRGLNGHLTKAKKSYVKKTGKSIPPGKSVVDKGFYDSLQKSLARKRSEERRSASMRELDQAFSLKSAQAFRDVPPPQIGEKGSWTLYDKPYLPVKGGSRRSPTKREYRQADEKILAQQRAQEELLALSGTKARELTDEEAFLFELNPRRPLDIHDLIRTRTYVPWYRS